MAGDAETVLAPVQPLLAAVFEAVQALALLLDQVSVLDSPDVTAAGLDVSDTETVGTDGLAGVTLVEMALLQAAKPSVAVKHNKE